ncbi:hypothetical protein K7957_15765 [Sphingomonas yunnanensis]|uniref:hypothetical protein n=1 Tax=Sphingomonas yunnanensis TaxID=310400 RepID=UPI001CA63C47|nr:hypothetical protein [Sphingomonas yunnanensis]MBY9064394.1 hypothetical protein [Sphingomonas yunnanensis]
MSDPERIAGRDVAEDMAALFGSGVRPAPATPPRPLPARSARRGRSLALGAAGLAVAVTAGVLAGTSAVGPAVSRPAAAAPSRAAVARAMPDAAPSRAPVALPPTALADLPAALPSPAEIARTAEHAPIDDRAAPLPALATPAPVAPRYTAPPRPVAAPRFAAAPRLPSAPTARPVAVRAVSGNGEGCLDDPYCAGERLYDADGEVASAYAEATQAGVSARLLRDYRGEWLRARRVGRNRPREALRVYGMVAADLRMLATDPGEDSRGNGRSTWR